MADERSASLSAAVMPSYHASTIPGSGSASSNLQATGPYEDATTALRSASLPTPAASSVSSETRSVSTTASSSPGGRGNQQHQQHQHNARPPASSHGTSRTTKFGDSGLPSTGKDNKTLRAGGGDGSHSARNIPSIIVNDAASFRPMSRPGSRPGSRWSERKWANLRSRRSGEFERPTSPPPPPVPQLEQTPFNGISLDIPTGSLDELGPQAMKFSKRGSLIKGGGNNQSDGVQKEEPVQQQQGEEVRSSLQQEEREKEEPQQSQQEPQPQETQEPTAPQEPQESPAPQVSQEQSQQPERPAQQDQPEQQKKADQSESQEQQVEKPQDVTPAPTTSADQGDAQSGMYGAKPRRLKPSSSLRVRQVSLPSRAISADEDMLSRRVRLMYEKGEENVSDSEVANSMAAENGVLWEEATPVTTDTSAASGSGPDATGGTETKRMSTLRPDRKSVLKKETNELAGGIEYWQNVGAGDVDRYGFIRVTNSADRIEPNPIQRVSTSLLLASETPRRKHSIRPSSGIASNRSFTGRSPTRKLSEPSVRPTSSQSTYSSPMRRSTSRFRSAANHLPHNRDRRFTDEAADMLTLPVDTGNAQNGVDSAVLRAMKKKEWEREDKWTKMARPTKKGKDGGGMTFEFDIHSSKLIERTWKGIPDRWRSTAWYSFLEASAKKHSDSPTEGELIEAYHEFQNVSSPDDVQIDIDVPRTITCHIMFRRRYRGGQRLLFRVLHSMSLYFPDTGYVQGMAALAATLLAYYDEEHAFIMLVRLWQLRGLERLYECGFAGLMGALDDFERDWLEGGEVATKLTDLGIPPTAYGTRWYLTLFNYSIPFPAQLRVWDVFMLLGDSDLAPSHAVLHRGPSKSQQAQTSGFGKSLDVLHATSAALIDGMRDIILESDFENAMKVLTSWVPIQDVEMFMRVAKAEWKVHHRKRML